MVLQQRKFCTAKETKNEMKRVTEWEKTFIIYAIDRGLIFRD